MRLYYFFLALTIIAGALRGGEPTPVEQLLSSLSNDDPAAREAASIALIERGTEVRAAVVKSWKGAKDPEARNRALAVVQTIDQNEFFSTMTSLDGPPPAHGGIGARDSDGRSSANADAGGDVTTLLSQADGSDFRLACKALVRLNEMAHGAAFDFAAPKDGDEMPAPFARLLVLFGRGRIVLDPAGSGQPAKADGKALISSPRPLGPDDIRALIARDPGEARIGKDAGAPIQKTRSDGGIYMYCYSASAQSLPIKRVSPVGIMHLFTYDAAGQIVDWRVNPGNGEWWLDVRFAEGGSPILTDSNGFSATFK